MQHLIKDVATLFVSAFRPNDVQRALRIIFPCQRLFTIIELLLKIFTRASDGISMRRHNCSNYVAPVIVVIGSDLVFLGDGTVDFIDFLSFMSKIVKQKIPDEDIEKCFKVFNEEDDGYLTIRGLQRVFLSLGQKPSDEELKEMMAFIDPENQDGLIQYDGKDLCI